MKKSFVSLASICVCLAILSVTAAAQEDARGALRDQYLISAKAGGVNYLEGAVGVARKKGGGGQLTTSDTLEIGDRVSTGADGKAEILLNPGSFLRLGGNTAFEFKTNGLDDLQLRLDAGSAILEVFATQDFEITVFTPKQKYVLLETGVYRIDVMTAGASRLEVWRGAARAKNSLDVARNGRVLTSTESGMVTVAKFERDQPDSLDTWSKLRGKELAKATKKLRDRSLRANLMRTFALRGWNVYQSYGLWMYDALSRTYIFLPFGRGWNSPYGYSYACHLGWYNLPPIVWYPLPHTSGGPTTSGPTVTPVISAGTRVPVPPFVRLEETMGGGGGRGGQIIDSGGSTYNPNQGSSSSPSYSPPPSPPSSLGTGKVDSAPTKQP